MKSKRKTKSIQVAIVEAVAAPTKVQAITTASAPPRGLHPNLLLTIRIGVARIQLLESRGNQAEHLKSSTHNRQIRGSSRE